MIKIGMSCMMVAVVFGLVFTETTGNDAHETSTCQPNITDDNYQTTLTTFEELIYLTFHVKNRLSQENGTDNHDLIINPWKWVISSESGLDLLALPLDYEVLSMGLLSDDVVNIDLNLTFLPEDCEFRLLESGEFVFRMRQYLKTVFKQRDIDDNHFFICNQCLLTPDSSENGWKVLYPYPYIFHANYTCSPSGNEKSITIIRASFMKFVHYTFVIICMYFPLFVYFAPSADTHLDPDRLSATDNIYGLISMLIRFLSTGYATKRGMFVRCVVISLLVQIPTLVRYGFNWAWYTDSIQLFYRVGIPLNTLRLLSVNSLYLGLIVTFWVCGSLVFTICLCRIFIDLATKPVTSTIETCKHILIFTGISVESVALDKFCGVYSLKNMDGPRRVFFALINRLLVIFSPKYWITIVSYSFRLAMPERCCLIYVSMGLCQRVIIFLPYLAFGAVLLIINLVFAFVMQGLLPLSAVIIMCAVNNCYVSTQTYAKTMADYDETAFVEKNDNDENTRLLGSSAMGVKKNDGVEISIESGIAYHQEVNLQGGREMCSSCFLSFVCFLICTIIVFDFYGQSISNVFEFVIFTFIIAIPRYPPKIIPFTVYVIAVLIYALLYFSDMAKVYDSLTKKIIHDARSLANGSVNFQRGKYSISKSLFDYIKEKHQPIRGQIVLFIFKLLLTCLLFYFTNVSLFYSSLLEGTDEILRLLCYILFLSIPGILRYLVMLHMNRFSHVQSYTTSIEQFTKYGPLPKHEYFSPVAIT